MNGSNASRLMKAHDARQLGHKVAFNFEDLKQKGEAYISQIREQAEQVLDDAGKEAQRIHDQSRQRGYEQGRAEALKDIEEEIRKRAGEMAREEVERRWQTTLPALETLVLEVAREKERWIAEWERNAVKLSIAIAERIIHRQVELNGNIPIEMVREALQLASGQERLSVRIHPDDLEGLGNDVQQIRRMISPVGEIEFIPDSECSRGGCLMQTHNGSIDARVETQLDRILAELSSDEVDSSSR